MTERNACRLVKENAVIVRSPMIQPIRHAHDAVFNCAGRRVRWMPQTSYSTHAGRALGVCLLIMSDAPW